jgi:heme A synthase
LSCLVWLTEGRSVPRWGGLVAIVAFVGLFIGHLHGSLHVHQRVLKATGELTQPDWLMAAGPTLAALIVTLGFAFWSLTAGGGGRRLLAILLLAAIMAQGVLGGLRVYFNALVGPDLALIHGVFSQVVVMLAVTLTVLCTPRRDVPSDDRWHPNPGLLRIGVLTAAVVFGQIVAGAIMRHTASPLGPRLHLLIAFLVVFAVAAVSRQSRGSPAGIRTLAILASSLAGLQILLGIEAWMLRFKAGFALAAVQPITAGDAVIRTLHALTGYGLFATTVALAVVLVRDRAPVVRMAAARQPQRPAEALV